MAKLVWTGWSIVVVFPPLVEEVYTQTFVPLVYVIVFTFLLHTAD
jgi:hypothetical protein